MTLLDNYFIARSDGTPCRPSLSGTYLVGQVYGDKRFPDGATIITSSLDFIGCGEAYTVNRSCYPLGRLHPGYVALYGDIDKTIRDVYVP